MPKFIAAVILILLLCGCATKRSDYSLNWESQSAVLYVYAPDGSEIPAFGTQLVTIPGYLFSQGAIHMHPGEHRIGYYCPRSDGIVIFDAIPFVYFTFKAGRTYELRCKGGEPVVSERADGA